MANGRFWLVLLRCLALLCLAASSVQAQLGTVGGPGFIVFGRVYLPDGKPASRVKVYLEMSNGLNRYIPSDDGGNYEFRGVAAGRYKVKAVNPDAAEQYSDVAESDSTRAYSNRVQIDVYLRLPLHKGAPDAKPGTISVAEAAQNIPKAARQAFEQGLKLQKENKPDKALIQFNQAIQEYPEYFQALTERGNLRMARNQLAEAAADFARALELNPKYAAALRGLGYCQLQQKQFEAAVANLENAYALAPDVALTLMLLGYANLSLNRYEPAQQCLQEALRLDAASAARAYVYLGEIYAHEQKFKEAADAINAYLKLKPDAADAARLKEREAQWRARGKSQD
ncbi:MAG: tetratricopeptide repeat protein [Acidobacteria bacterium]|nr:tetratricopeptide repeat protein [Acidobacteriota bacterium]MBI3426117.1 tetratricopeptide repeat protein [Acidobacteriota bacterium]